MIINESLFTGSIITELEKRKAAIEFLIGRLQDDICSAPEGHFCPGVLVYDRRSTSLYIITAHHNDNIITLKDASGLLQMVFMSLMKRIVLRDDTCNSHVFYFPVVSKTRRSACRVPDQPHRFGNPMHVQ